VNDSPARAAKIYELQQLQVKYLQATAGGDATMPRINAMCVWLPYRTSYKLGFKQPYLYGAHKI